MNALDLRTISRNISDLHTSMLAVLGWFSYMAIFNSSLSNIFWSGSRDGDATERVRASNGITNVETRVQAGSNRGPVRHTLAFRVQIGSRQKAYKSSAFSERCW